MPQPGANSTFASWQLLCKSSREAPGIQRITRAISTGLTTVQSDWRRNAAALVSWDTRRKRRRAHGVTVGGEPHRCEEFGFHRVGSELQTATVIAGAQ